VGGGALDWSGLPVVLCGCADDPWVPAWRMRETAQVFSAAGAAVEFTLFPGDAHHVPDAQLAAARAVLVQLGAD
jgi:predicted esterase